MVEKAKTMLNDNIIPFWHKLRDNEYGGFYGLMDFDLRLDKKAVKGCILNSRILWFFSNAYLVSGNDQNLDDAKHAFEFLRDYCVDRENGGIYWALNYDGSAADTIKHTYNQAFAVYALASYHLASKNKEALDLAFELFHLIESKFTDKVGYCEAYDKNFKPVLNDKLSENGVMASKTMNSLLHLFEAYSELYKAQKNAEVEKAMRKILGFYSDKVFNPDRNRLEVFFDTDMNSIIDLHSYGHDIEASWLMDIGTVMLGDDELTAKISAINSKLANNIITTAYHENSLWNECEKGVDDKHRIWWVQSEAVLGFLNEYQKHPEKNEYLKAAQNVLSYIQEFVVDKRPGSEWFSVLNPDGTPVKGIPIVEPWKCPYHNGRMCIEIIKRLENK
jgi:mannobiose 2-epimerase